MEANYNSISEMIEGITLPQRSDPEEEERIGYVHTSLG